MKKSTVLLFLCAAALTACAEKKKDNSTGTVSVTEATTAIAEETVTTTAEVTTTAAVSSSDENAEPAVMQTAKLPEYIFEEYEFDTLRYYNGRTYDSLTEEERNSSNSPFYNTLEGELTDEHKQMLYDYFTRNDFEEADYNEVSYMWNCGLPIDQSPEKSLIWLPMKDKQEWLESGHTPHLGASLDFIFSYDKKYFAVRRGVSGSFNTYKTAAPEELDFLYELAGV